MDATPTFANPRQPGTRALAWMGLVAAVLQVVAPIITINGPGRSPGNGSGPELLITPAGWAFSIWGVIYTLAISQAIVTLLRGADATPRRLQIDQLVLYLAAALWIVLAAIDSSLATAAALLLMLVAAIDGLLTAAKASFVPRWFGVLTRGAIGLYAGWVTAAFFLNVSTALVDSGMFAADELPWQLGMLLVAASMLLAVTFRAGGIPTYAAAGTWALIGIAVTGVSEGTTEVTVAALGAAVVLVAAAAVVHAHGRRPTASTPA